MANSNIIQIVGNPYTVGKIKDIKEPSSVIMLSGGIDSVSVLKRILEETDERIYAHHIHIKNNSGAQYKRYKAEAEAVRKVVPYMKRTFRDFHYSESTIDTRQIMNLFPTDIKEEEDEIFINNIDFPDQLYFHFIAGMLAKVTHSINVYIGTCKEDYMVHSNGNILGRYAISGKIREATAHPFEVTLQNPHDNQSKKENMEYLGKELMEMVWYCREPSFKNNKLITCNTKQEEEQNYQLYSCQVCTHVRSALLEIEEEEYRRIENG